MIEFFSALFLGGAIVYAIDHRSQMTSLHAKLDQLLGKNQPPKA